LLRLARHAFSAFASFCAFVGGFVVVVGGARLPAPENVALDGAPKIGGCGVGAGLQEASVAHGGGCTAEVGMHGEALVHSCAS
jgi:hypothetical protein